MIDVQRIFTAHKKSKDEKPMINENCPMTNERGYALITMTFIMVTFLSVVLLVSYPLVKEARDQTASYIVDRNDYRFRKALFGEAVDQCGTKLAHQGGHYSDYPDSGGFGTKRYYYQTRVTARVFGTLGYPNRVEVPEDYEYMANTFWAGYWGKRYLHILPGDKWDYVTLYSDLGNISFDLYAPFRQPYASVFIASICGGIATYNNFAKGKLESYSSFEYFRYGNVSVEVKDYSKNATYHELRLITVGASNYYFSKADQNIFFERVEGPTHFSDYLFYEFKQLRCGGSSSTTAQNSGQKKLTIQVKVDGSDSWTTMDTKVIVLPVNVGNGSGRLIYRVNFYG